MPQAVLGVAFSFGIPMAFSAVLGGSELRLSAVAESVPPHAWALLASNLFWVMAYDTEYAMVDRDDDLKIGIRTSAITLGRFDVVGVMAFYGAYLVSWALLGRLLGLGLWFMAGMMVAALQTLWHFTLIRDARARGRASRPSGSTTGSGSRCSPGRRWTGAALSPAAARGRCSARREPDRRADSSRKH